MKRKVVHPRRTALIPQNSPTLPPTAGFDEVLVPIQAARTRAVTAINTALIDLYRSIGQHISWKVAADGWEQGTVAALADHIRRRLRGARGFFAQNLRRVRQFFDIYRGQPKLATLLRKLSWSHNLAIMRCGNRDQEREFYLREGVVEYALSRSASPAIVADYQMRLPDKQLLRASLHEFYESAQSQAQAQKHVSALRKQLSVNPGKRNN
jgi:hypothetical protein